MPAVSGWASPASSTSLADVPFGSLPNHCRDGSEHDPTAQPLLPALLDSGFRRNDGGCGRKPFAGEGRGRGCTLFLALWVPGFAGMTGYRVKTGPRITLAASLAMKVAILATSSGSVRLATSAS